MKSTVEALEGNKVKLTIEVDEAEFEKAIDSAFKKIAREVRVPGFRPGKAPRKVLEARIGTEAARGQAINDALPEYYAAAVREHDVDVIAAPDIDVTAGQEEGRVAFDAVVEVRPVIVVGGYKSLRVTIPSPLPTDDEIDQQIENLRGRFATTETVDRPAADGDFVVLDIAGSQAGEPIEGLTADDYSYQVGSGFLVPEADEVLVGAKVGDIFELDADHPDPDESDKLHLRILVKEVKARILPDLDDDFADEASEFETLAELRDDLAGRLGKVKKMRAQMAARERTTDALAELVDEEAPGPLVADELRARLQDLAMRLSAQGIPVEQYLAMTGKSQEDVVDELRSQAETSVKVDLALRAIAEAEGIDVTDEDLQGEYEAIAPRVNQKPDQVRKQLERGGQVEAVRSDLRSRKTFEWLVERVEIVDEDGNPIALASLEIEPEGADLPGGDLPAGANEGTEEDDDDENDENDESDESDG